MMASGSWSLAGLQDTPDPLLYLETALKTPQAGLFRDIRTGVLDDIFDRTPESCRAALAIVLLSSALLDPGYTPPAISNRLKKEVWRPDGELLPWPWPVLSSATWRCVPVVVADHTDAGIEWFMTGWIADPQACGPILPDWADAVLDPATTAQAVKNAAVLAGRLHSGGFVAWPMRGLGKSPRICDGSLALPLCLGFLAAAEGYAWPDVAATGVLSSADSNSVEEVSWLPRKAECARCQGLKALLIPACCTGPASDGIEILPVATIDDAAVLCRHFAPGEGRRMLSLLAARETPEDFIRLIPEAPTTLVPWLEQNSELIAGIVRNLCDGQSRGLDVLLTCIERTVRDYGMDLTIVNLLLNAIEKDDIVRIGLVNPRLSWDLCAIKLCTCSYLGMVSEATTWLELAENYKDMMARNGEAKDDVFLFYIRKTVCLMHNCYRFDPSLDGIVTGQFDALHKMILGDYERYKDFCFCAISPSLGKYYGTLAQNFGFCGPTYLSSAVKYANKSINFFGNFEYTNTIDQCCQGLSYRLFAYLDAGRLPEAKADLLRYLGVNEMAAIQVQDKDPFQLFALARYLRAVKACRSAEPCARLVGELLAILAGCPERHPWQLILYNTGYVVRTKKDAAWCWLESARICLGSFAGDTIRAMALLGLAALYVHGLGDPAALEKQAAFILGEIARGPLNKEHFASLLEVGEGGHVLEIVCREEDRLFPYMYR